jgi:hypothetical protein
VTGDEPGMPNPIEELRQIIGSPYDTSDFDDVPGPTSWPLVPAADAAAEWDDLRTWVDALQQRFPHLDHHVIPRCWWRHNGHVEALCALRDHERSSFSETAPATAPVDWLRALRDISTLLKAWTAEVGCGSAHQDPPVALRTVERGDWERHVRADVRRRHEREIDEAAAAPDG